ncbi:hypothetical protein BCR33DRAFT_718877 [Rhizoclosmatium globosum]|uniref:Carbohydrate kinase PfkB domain-containing protein n=1 Tax=Rhizoclosmatium globosum TaxID=329046 RepID=A0A1Y2C2I2_9FUNG|nr:hypothetical protein BCR33DRAFT_718877 [Rhizoclosmatium globosum]|eukprot:ORY41211.1 hypothetical protein BCR33DRAFT_718877 [Rhizoclosmatium globosum]
MSPPNSVQVFVSGACYQDVILHVDSFPREDAKMRANEVEKRRGGNGANVLQVLSQFQNPLIRRPGAASASATSSDALHPKLSTSLVAVLAGDKDAHGSDSFILNDLRTNLAAVSLDHCVFRGNGYSEPTAWIVATKTTRTIINHTTLPELSHAEFKLSMLPAIDRVLKDPSVAESLWFHFEGRNVDQMEQMVDWLIQRRESEVVRAESEGRSGWWKPVDKVGATVVGLAPELQSVLGRRSPSINSATSNEGTNAVLSGSVAGVSPGGNALGKRESKDFTSNASASTSTPTSGTINPASLPPAVVETPATPLTTQPTSQLPTPQPRLPQFTISVEFEKPNRPGLDNLLPKVDVLFFSKWYAEGRGFPNAPTGFLDNIRRECKPGAILFLTWAEQGCFFLVNEVTRPAQTHHVPAPAIFPVDTIGAGDTFAAGILYSLGVLGMDVRSGCEFAVRLATAKCAQVGFDGLAERVF